MSNTFERVVSVILCVSAVAIAATVVLRGRGERSPVFPYHEQWKTFDKVGVVTKNPNAKVQFVEVADLQCPVCREMEPWVRAVLARYPDEVTRVFVHWPLNSHKFAVPAARAAECAFDQGKFDEMVGAIYAKQDSLGKRRWEAFGADAGVPDSAAFARCVHDTRPLPRVEAGQVLAQSLGLRGTPMFIVNGWQVFPGSEAGLIQFVDDIVKAGKPAGAKRFGLF